VRGSLQAVLVTVLVCVFSATIGATVGSSQTRSVAGTISLRAFAGETVITPKVASASTAPDGFPSFSRFAEQVQTLPNLSPKPGWPSPVDDREHRLFTLVDVLEYRPRVGSKETNDDYRWDIEGWYGGDYNRVWFKSEGQRDTAFKANYDVDFQLLYGRFIRKYYDFQIGGRVETQSFRGSNVTRGLAAIGIEGLVPYNYQIEPTLFIAQNGAVSARLSLTKDLLMTQRLILQLRFETNAAIQRVVEFTTGSGLNNLEFGFRLRYEIRRGFAPYVGLSLDRSFGDTATLVRQDGGNPSQVRLAAGVRMWF
jgi:copper resistance protein B